MARTGRNQQRANGQGHKGGPKNEVMIFGKSLGRLAHKESFSGNQGGNASKGACCAHVWSAHLNEALCVQPAAVTCPSASAHNPRLSLAPATCPSASAHNPRASLTPAPLRATCGCHVPQRLCAQPMAIACPSASACNLQPSLAPAPLRTTHSCHLPQRLIGLASAACNALAPTDDMNCR